LEQILNLREMSDEELRKFLEDLRSRRKKGYEIDRRFKRQAAPKALQGISAEIAEKVLKELLKEVEVEVDT